MMNVIHEKGNRWEKSHCGINIKMKHRGHSLIKSVDLAGLTYSSSLPLGFFEQIN